MAKSKKRRGMILLTGATLSILVFLLSPLNTSASAFFDNADFYVLLLRFRNEVILKYPVGEYYEALFWVHADELNGIYSNAPEHAEEIGQVARLFVPGMEALLDDRGETIFITGEQVNRLQAELDWAVSVGSQSLREDIEKESKLFPLEIFAGMTMNQAVEYLDSNWTPAPPTEPLLADATIGAPFCAAGFGAECLTKPLLVPDSNSQQAYYVFDNVYFEYPSDWQIQKIFGNSDELLIAPAPDSAEAGAFQLIAFMFSKDLVIENWTQLLVDPPPLWQRPNTEWRSLIYLDDFQGFENFWRFQDDPIPDLEFFLYNEDYRLGFGLFASPVDRMNASLITSAEAAHEMFPGIYQIIESIRIWEK